MLQPHDQVGRYEIRRRVAQGGMGTLYLAHDSTLDRLVALKLFQSGMDDPEARDRFAREARAAAALSHPNIVTIYDFGDYVSHPYIVMEFIQGETLAEVIHRKALVGVAAKLRWMEQLCSAVGYAHAGGIIHRDVKPPNLMIDPHGRLKVLDFGIARMRGSLASTATARVGTPGYMAPEQLRGGVVNHRSDLFSVGAVCYELFANVEAFGAGNEHLATHQILHEEPTPLTEACPGIDVGLAAIVAKALQKSPDERFQDAEALMQALAAVRSRVESLEPDTMVSRYAPPPSGPVTGPPPRHTPPVDRARADREAIVKKRTAQIRQAVDLASDYLHQGDLTGAREQCNAVFALDRAHPEALAIQRAIEERENGATVLVRRPTGPVGHPNDQVQTKVVRRMDVVQSVPEADVTVLRPVAPLPPPPATNRVRDAAEDNGTILVRPEPVPPLTPVKLPPAPALPKPRAKTKVQPPRPPASDRIAWLRSRQGKQTMLLGGGATLLIAVVMAVLLTRENAPPPPLPAIAVVIDAVPWGTVSRVERIEKDQGIAVELPPELTTPLVMPLLPGRYRVLMSGPQNEPRELLIDVAANAPAVFLERFTPLTVDGYFDVNLDRKAQPVAGQPADRRSGQ